MESYYGSITATALVQLFVCIRIAKNAPEGSGQRRYWTAFSVAYLVGAAFAMGLTATTGFVFSTTLLLTILIPAFAVLCAGIAWALRPRAAVETTDA